jgi:hypothetical protein
MMPHPEDVERAKQKGREIIQVLAAWIDGKTIRSLEEDAPAEDALFWDFEDGMPKLTFYPHDEYIDEKWDVRPRPRTLYSIEHSDWPNAFITTTDPDLADKWEKEGRTVTTSTEIP